MIELNGKRFARDEAEMVESLFHAGGTCSGTYTRAGGEVRLFNPQGELIGVINRHGVLCCATRLDDGRIWFNLATIRLIGAWDSYSRQVEECRAVLAGDMRPATYDEAKAECACLTACERAAAAALRAIPGVGSGPNGLTPDGVKFSPRYMSARRDYEAARAALARFNGWYTARFKAELRRDRAERDAARLAALAPADEA